MNELLQNDLDKNIFWLAEIIKNNNLLLLSCLVFLDLQISSQLEIFPYSYYLDLASINSNQIYS